MADSLRVRRARAAMQLVDPEHDESVWVHLLGVNSLVAMDYGRALLALRNMYSCINEFVERDIIPEASTPLESILKSIPPEVRELLDMPE